MKADESGRLTNLEVWSDGIFEGCLVALTKIIQVWIRKHKHCTFSGHFYFHQLHVNFFMAQPCLVTWHLFDVYAILIFYPSAVDQTVVRILNRQSFSLSDIFPQVYSSVVSTVLNYGSWFLLDHWEILDSWADKNKTFVCPVHTFQQRYLTRAVLERFSVWYQYHFIINHIDSMLNLKH